MTASIALTADEARDRTDAIRADLQGAVTGIRYAIQDGIPAALGYDSPWSWADAEFGDLLRELKLPKAVRLELVESMGDDVSVRQAADRLGVSPQTIQADRAKLGKVIPIGPRQPAQAAPAGRKYEQAAEYLRRAEDGLTLVELARVTGWTEGSASGVLTDVIRRHLARRVEDKRDGQRIHYAITED
jgi:hypothetical protein